MAIRYKILENQKLVYAVGEDILSFDDLMSHIEELAKDSKYISPMLKLVDYRNLKGYALTMDESIAFATRKSAFSERFLHERCAFVVPSELGYGMARHHQAFIDAEVMQTCVFKNLPDAVKWLGIEVSERDLYIA